MLKQLSIKNIAIIESLSLVFHEGLTVITGESGSGKSILLDAIALAFGAKVSPRDVLRAGAERGQVELLFDIGKLSENREFQDFLAEQGVALLPQEQELLLSRELTPGGSRSRINGIPVTRDVLENLRPWVIDLHGQHELTSLFQKDQQRAYLDGFGGAALQKLKQQVILAYEDWHTIKQRLEALTQNRQQLEQQRDWLRFQLQELEEAQLSAADEDVQTKQTLDVLAHADKLIHLTTQGADLLSEGNTQAPGILDQLSKLAKRLSEGASYDSAVEAFLTRLQGAVAELHELAGDLSRYADRAESNPEQMDALTDRLDILEKLKRKYGPTLEAVIAKREQLVTELEGLESGEQNVEALQSALVEKTLMLQTACQALRVARQALAIELKQRLMEQLQMLAMPAVGFDVQITELPYSREGTESIEFVFSANPGEPMRPLAKVASGGELSRFLLALKVLTAESDGLLTLVFDEIDTGISGPTAKTVAEKLAALSRHLQVLTITHQPMIAAMGQQHWHVEKTIITTAAGQDAVAVEVHALERDENQRLKILSRLVSGLETNDATVEKFIQRLREQAKTFYQASLSDVSVL